MGVIHLELIPVSLTGLPPEMIIPVLICYVLIALIKSNEDNDRNIG